MSSAIEERLLLIAEGLAIQNEIALLRLAQAMPDLSALEPGERAAATRGLIRLTNRLGDLTEAIGSAAKKPEKKPPTPHYWTGFEV